MPQQARDAEFAPHAAIDLRDQNSMFLALEELGIACMQDAWIRSNDPGHKDAAAVHEQAEEFLADILMLLSTGGDESRIVQNGWAAPSSQSTCAPRFVRSLPPRRPPRVLRAARTPCPTRP